MAAERLSRPVRVTGGQLAVDVAGAGPPVVLVHSGVTDGRQWEALERLLVGRRTVVRYDRRGYGRSKSTRRGRYSPALDLLELVDALDLERPVVCGNSAGALAALEAAAVAPGRFERLVLLAPPLPDWEWSAEIVAYAEAEEEALGRGDIEAAVGLNVDMWVHDPAHREAVAAMQRRAFENQRRYRWQEIDLEPPVTERLHEVHGPVHLMVGEHDSDDFRAIAWHLADRLPGARAEEVPGAGHLLGLERPEVVAAVL